MSRKSVDVGSIRPNTYRGEQIARDFRDATRPFLGGRCISDSISGNLRGLRRFSKTSHTQQPILAISKNAEVTAPVALVRAMCQKYVTSAPVDARNVSPVQMNVGILAGETKTLDTTAHGFGGETPQ